MKTLRWFSSNDTNGGGGGGVQSHQHLHYVTADPSLHPTSALVYTELGGWVHPAARLRWGQSFLSSSWSCRSFCPGQKAGRIHGKNSKLQRSWILLRLDSCQVEASFFFTQQLLTHAFFKKTVLFTDRLLITQSLARKPKTLVPAGEQRARADRHIYKSSDLQRVWGTASRHRREHKPGRGCSEGALPPLLPFETRKKFGDSWEFSLFFLFWKGFLSVLSWVGCILVVCFLALVGEQDLQEPSKAAWSLVLSAF